MPSDARPLFTPSFVLICLVNFFTFSSFYLLMPVIPLYLVDGLGLGAAYAGVIIALYAVSALSMRPFSGYLADALPRKKLFLAGGCMYVLSFAGYLLFVDPVALMGVRVAQGLTFGLFTTTSATLAVDIIPEERMGTGISLFSGVSALSMVMGPAAGMAVLDVWGYRIAFMTAMTLACLCPLLGLCVRAAPRGHKPVVFSLKNLFLRQGAWAALTLTLAACIYGLVMNYFPLFVREQGLNFNSGLFLAVMGAGLVGVRFFTGGILDRGHLLKPLLLAKVVMIFSVALFLLLKMPMIFFVSAFCFGAGYGLLMPTYQLIFVRLAPPGQRGAANSSFFIALDGGIGSAILLGGIVAQSGGYSLMYALGAGLLGLSALLFALIVWPGVKSHCQ